MRIPFALTKGATSADYAYTNNGLEVDLGIKFNSFKTTDGDTILLAFDEVGNGFALRKTDIEGWAEILDEQVLIDAANNASDQITGATSNIISESVSQSVAQSKGYTDEKFNAITTGFQGALTISQVPATDGIYIASESGTYTNAGNIVVDLSDGVTLIVKQDDSYTKVVIPIDLSGYVAKTDIVSGFQGGDDKVAAADDVKILNTVINGPASSFDMGVSDAISGYTTGYSSSGTILNSNNAATLEGELKSITFYCAVVGDITFKQLKVGDDGKVTNKKNIILYSAAATGEITLTAGSDFDEGIILDIGDTIGAYQSNSLGKPGTKAQTGATMLLASGNIAIDTPTAATEVSNMEFGVIFKLEITSLDSKIESIKEGIDSNITFIAGISGGDKTIGVSDDLDTYSALSSFSGTVANKILFANPGILKQIDIYVAQTGSITIKIFGAATDTDTYPLKKNIAYNAAGTGKVTLVAGTDFDDDVEVEKGGMIAFYISSSSGFGKIGYKSKTADSYVASGNPSGDVIFVPNTGLQWGYTCEIDEYSLEERVSDIEKNGGGGGGGQAYDQTLNTTDSVKFAGVETDALKVNGLPTSEDDASVGGIWIDTANGNVLKVKMA